MFPFFKKIPKDSLPYINSNIVIGQLVVYPEITVADKESVRKELEGIREEILKGEAKFSSMASVKSEDPGSAANGGSLGEVLDSIVEIVESNGEEVSETVFLPAIFNFRIGKKISKKLMADAILQHTFAQGNIPYLRARITKSNKNCTYGASLGLGGFEKSMNIGFHGTALLMGQVYLQAQVAGLESYFVPSFFQGLQASVGIGVLL